MHRTACVRSHVASSPFKSRVARVSPRHVLTVPRSAAVDGSTVWDTHTLKPLVSSYEKPLPLPEPPEEATLVPVMRYIASLVLSERQGWRIVAALCVLVASKASGLVAPFYFKSAVDALFDQSGGQGIAMCVKGLVAFGACRILSLVSKELQLPLFAPLAQALGRRLAHHTFSHVLNLDVTFHLNRQTGLLSRVLERGTRAVQSLFRAVMFTFMPILVEMCIVCTMLSSLFNSAVVGVVLATFVIYVLWTERYIKESTTVRKMVNDLDAQTTGKAVDALLNFEVVTLFNNQQMEVNQYDMFLRGYQQQSIRLDWLGSVLNGGQALILNIGIVGALVAAVTCSPTPVTPGDLVLIQVVLLQLWAPLQFLGWFSRELRQSLVDMEAFLGILKTKPAIDDGTVELDLSHSRTKATAPVAPMAFASSHPNGALPLHDTDPERAEPHYFQDTDREFAATSAADSEEHARRAAGGNGVHASGNGNHAERPAAAAAPPQEASVSGSRGLTVEMRDVHFGYTTERQVLNGLSLSVKAGERVAIVGPSGSGKSTVLRLTARLYDPTSGAVLVQGTDIRQLKQSSLRSAMAVVPQDTVLFNDTIMENIRYGKPGASDEEVIEAAMMAQLDATVNSLPEGFSTPVGERGLKLSGGEKQRVAIARAFLQDPMLLICDEATSALDTATEQGIMKSLDELAKGRTSVFVAHRLSTVMSCDKIVVLSEGRMVEQGSHAQLLALNGVYADMWEMQAGEEVTRLQMQPPAPQPVPV